MILFILLFLLVNNVYAEVCLGTQRVQDTFAKTMYAKYEGNTCSGPADCESKCTSGCSGYSKTPSETVVVQVSMGTNFGCALHSDGTVKCWGANTYGQLGDDSTTTRTTPVDVTLDSAAVRVECGMYHTCAILDTGKVQCWGRNNYGQLGIDSTTTQKTPVTVLHIDGANDLSLGQEHTCVLINTDAKCWGRNTYGALGIGSTATKGDGGGEMEALQKIDIGGFATQITAGRYFTCVLTINSEVKCWGYGAKGQLGNGLTTNIGDANNEMGDNLAVTLTGVHKVAAATDATCAVMKDLSVRCWGLGGRIGYDDTTQRNTPGPRVNMGGNVVDINGGTDTFCAVFNDGQAKCWGNGDHGKLGITGHQGDAMGEMEALPFIDLSATGSDCWMISTGGLNTCALVDGELNCFALNNLGQTAGNGLGANTATYTYTYGSKSALIGISTQLTDACAPCKANEYVESQYEQTSFTVEAGQTSYTCETLAECKPQCDADPNCVGYSEDAGLEIVKVGYSFMNAENVLYSDGTVKCFAASGWSASCGTDDDSTFYDPADSSTWGTTKLSGPAVDMSRWGDGTFDEAGGCAVMTDGTLECWCSKNYGGHFKFVNGNTFAGDGNNPMADNRLLDTGVYRFRNFTGGYAISCGILRDDYEGQLACWGWKIGKKSDDPAIINQGTVTDVSCGRYFCCYIIGGQVSCFGDNAYGQLGIGSTTAVSVSTVTSSSTIAAVDIGTHVAAKVFCSWKSTRVVTTNGDLIGWGSVTFHDLGYNDADYTFGSNQGDEAGEMGDNLIVTLTNVKESHGRRQYSNSALQNDGTVYWTHKNINGWTSFTNTKMKTAYSTSIQSIAGLTDDDLIALFDGNSDAVSETPAYSPIHMKNIGLQCVACAEGTYNSPGDKTEGTCDDALTCDANFYSDGTQCIICPDGSYSEGASVIDGQSYCKRYFPCGTDEYVNIGSKCALCAFGTFSDAVATEHTDTPCQKPAGTCGENEHSSIQYFETSNRYTGGTCTDCETDCTNNPTCLGYSNGDKVFSVISHRGGYTCSASNQGVRCWGINKDYAFGIGSTDTALTATLETSTLLRMTGIKALRNPHNYASFANRGVIWAIFHDGTARCWGYSFAYCGYSVTTDVTKPGPNIYAHGGKIKDIRGSFTDMMMLLEDGRVFGWGSKFADSRNYETNSAIDLGGTVTAISVGAEFYCALIDAKVKCWGNLLAGQETSSTTPSPDLPFLKGLDKPVVDIQSSNYGTCALFNDGTVKCWGGGNALGWNKIHSVWGYNVGDAEGEMEAAPYVDIAGVEQLSAGWDHFCARLDTGGVKCWGRNANCGVGYNCNDYSTHMPQDELSLGVSVDKIISTYYGNFAIVDGNVKAWGYDVNNRLGYSENLDRAAADASFLFSEVYDNTYGSMVSSGLGMAKRSSCGTCPVNTTRPAGDSLSEATWCISETTCGKDEFMNTNYECEPCPDGVYNNAGDNSPGICNDQAICTENQHVSNGMCLDCPANTTNPAGDDTNNGNTYCTLDVACAQNEFVNYEHQCTACPEGLYNDVGDNTVGSCDDTEKCLSGYHVKTTFESDNLKKFGPTSCDNVTDCETQCTANATCLGYSLETLGPVWFTVGTENLQYHYLKTSLDGSVVVAYRAWSKIVVSRDYGVTWSTVYSGDNIKDFDLSDDGSVIALAIRDTQVALSTDAGVTWSNVGPTDKNNGIRVSGDGNTIMVGGWNSGMYLSNDGGDSWTTITGNFTGTYGKYVTTNCISMSFDGSVIFYAPYYNNGGQLFVSTDGGTTWTQQTSMLENVASVRVAGTAMSSDGTTRIIARSTNINFGPVEISYDSGATFTVITALGNKWWGWPSMSRDGTKIVIHEMHGSSWISTDSGQTWTENTDLTEPSSVTLSGDGEYTYALEKAQTSGIYKGTFTKNLAYGPQITGIGTSFVKDKGCKLCPVGYNNEPMDDPLLEDTTCDFLPCSVNHKVVDGVCTPCISGSTRPAGDADPLVNTYCFCGVNQHVVNNVCTECPTGGTRPAGDDEAGNNTECLIAPCAQDYHVKNGECVPCPTGLTNEAGDTNEFGDTYCDANFVCLENQYVSNHQCLDCPAGQTHPYGADPGGANTTCSWITCAKDEYSDGTQCQACAYGTYNNAGDSLEHVTTCDDTEICDETQYSTFKFNLHTGKQISNAAGYSDGITDLAKAKRMCIKDSSCKGLTEDSGNYYLSDGTLSANVAYNAYELDRSNYECAVCVGGESPYTDPLIDRVPNRSTSCTFSNCLINQYADDFVCYDCPEGQVKSPAGNPAQDFSCTIVPCGQNEYVVDNNGVYTCTPCPEGGTNDPGDTEPGTCDFPACGKNQYSSSQASGGLCLACPEGQFNDPGDSRGSDTTCDDLELCDANEYGLNGVCTACPGAGTNEPNRVNETGTCTFPDCQTDQYSLGDGICLACPIGRTMPTPVNPSVASQCLCAANQYASFGLCEPCADGFTNEAGDDPNNGNTLCDFTPCEANHYVDTSGVWACTPCPEGTYSAGGLAMECGSTEYCTSTQKVADVFVEDTNKYGSISCDNYTDCEAKCLGNSTCEGYTIAQSAFNMVDIAGVSVSWFSVAMSGDGQTIVAGGYTSNLWVSTDGGNSWNEDTSIGQAHPYKSIAISADGQYVAAAAYNNFNTPYLFYSTDYGATFTQKNFAYSKADGIAISDDGQIIAVAHNSPNIYNIPVSTDGGDTWTDGNQAGEWRSIAMSADGTKMIACEYSSTTYTGYVWLSDDTGATWSNTGSQKSWKHVSMSADGSKMIAMANGELLFCSSNCGSSSNWVNIEPTSDIAQFPTISRDGSTIIIGGGSGAKEKVYTSTDDGATWTTYTTENTQDQRNTDLSADGSILAMMSKNQVGMWLTGQASSEYGALVAGTGNSFGKDKGCKPCPAGYENPLGPTTTNSTNGICVPIKCQSNQYSDGSICHPCPAFTGSDLSDYDPTLAATTCQPIACEVNQYVLNHECQPCSHTSYRAAGDEIFGTDTHCFCKDDHKVINKQCIKCEQGSSNPNLCYSGLEDHYCVCHENYHVVNNLCTECPHGATRPAGDYAGNADTHCICGTDQHVVNNQCVTCPLGSSRPAGDDSSGPNTECSCSKNEHVLNGECVSCPAGSTRLAGDLVSDGDTYCICEENHRVQDNQCVPCENGSLRAAGDNSAGNNTYCACLEGQHVQNHICTACPANYSNVAGEDATGDDTNCTCAENFYSNGNGCVACSGTSIIPAGSDPTVPSECYCPINYEPDTCDLCDTCVPCDDTEESLGGTDICKCKENHRFDGTSCTPCIVGSTRPAGDDKNSTTECTPVECAENQKVVNHECQACITGMVRPAGDLATGADTECTYEGTVTTVSVVGNYFYSIGGSNNPELTMRVGETKSFVRDSAGDPFRIVTEAECEGLQCDKAQYTTLPTGTFTDAVKDQSVTVFSPTTAGIYYYLSTENGYRKGRIVVDWPLCTITYPVTNITESCELDSEIVLSGDLTIQFVTVSLRAVQGDIAQIKAADSSRHFQVTNGHKLTMDSIDLNGGRAADGGSILVDNGNIDANNVKFSDNVATSSGGAIKVKNTLSTIVISNILFENNQGSEGGALDIQDTLVQQAEIHSSDFKNNRAASGNGGAIKTNAPLNITLSNFEGNLANAGEGGGITATKDITISGSSFKNNRAMKGGALKSVGNKITMSNMVIEANEAIEDGGAFSVENAEVDVRTSTIKANKAKRGGAMKIVATGCTTDCKTIKIQQSTLEANEAYLEGGAVDLGGDTNAVPQFWVQDSNMKDNKAAGTKNDFKQRQNAKIKAIDSEVEAIDGGDVDIACEAGQCDGRPHSTCEVTATGTTCACDGVTRFLDGTTCKPYKTCPELGLQVTIHNGTKTHDKLCGTPEIQNIVFKLDEKGKALAEMIEQKLVAEGVAADQAYALAVEVFGEINKCS